eukprot:CAMPEP_0117674522 /NCGR_PEP_ID=MMETSP0804-20121206/15089_1 /TAXON_ID=1074897 /ORGANISM="Tetraselmis astigmatica, Strain CCMP880" /LENGTH=529 /DNA_ID=CAMNT_0005483409 /DNA_START=75 /DNA_END=1664 /DNA_ORIENTATION=-
MSLCSSAPARVAPSASTLRLRRSLPPSALTRTTFGQAPGRCRSGGRCSQRSVVQCSAAGSTAALARAAGAVGNERQTLEPVVVRSAASGEEVTLGQVLPASGRAIVAIMTQFGDFDSFEQAQRMVDELPGLDEAGVKVVAIGIGNVEAAQCFAKKTNFPVGCLYADETAACCKALGFAPGWGREGGPGAWAAKLPLMNGYVKLIVMCTGIGSPGTLKEVIRGYTGDRDALQVFNDNSNVDLPWKAAFNLAGGKGFQRPFELATFRLSNMIAILKDWGTLAPKDSDLLVQRGGALVLDGNEVLYRHDDQGILGYAPAARLARKAKADDPRVIDAVAVCKEAAATRAVDGEDVFRAITCLEKAKDKDVSLQGINGRWRLQWTTGTAKVSANVNRKGDGSYFPVRAEQSFDVGSMRIRNGIYLGPLSFYFDGPFKWDDLRGVLEFTFTRVSLALGSLGPWSKEIQASDWEDLKAGEEQVTSGRGKVTSTKGKRKAVPFFKFVLADGEVIAARGRGGGLALWRRVGEPEVAKD